MPLLIAQAHDESCHHHRGVGDEAAVMPVVQRLGGAVHGEREAREAAVAEVDHLPPALVHGAIAHDQQVALEQRSVGGDQLREVRRALFLLALVEQLHVHREFVPPRAQCIFQVGSVAVDVADAGGDVGQREESHELLEDLPLVRAAVGAHLIAHRWRCGSCAGEPQQAQGRGQQAPDRCHTGSVGVGGGALIVPCAPGGLKRKFRQRRGPPSRSPW
jgi:hypothetical protein